MKRKIDPSRSLCKWVRNFSCTFVIVSLTSFALWLLDSTAPPSLPASAAPPTFYANQTGADLTYTFTEAMNRAKKSIFLLVYTLTDENIIHALKEKSRQGVKVKVVSDAKASPYIDSKLGQKVDVLRRFGPGIMHLKILVIDEEMTFIGSANMTKDSLQSHGNLVLGVPSLALAKYVTAKAESLDIERLGAPFNHQEFTCGGQKLDLWFLPDNREASLKLKSLIRSAKKTIRIAMFTWTRKDFAQNVIDAVKRGVDAEVVIDYYQGKGASESIVQLLKKQGVKVRISRGGPLLHHKFLVVDDQTLVNGSANWTKAAFTRNDDCFIILTTLTEDQKAKLKSLWNIIWTTSIPP